MDGVKSWAGGRLLIQCRRLSLGGEGASVPSQCGRKGDSPGHRPPSMQRGPERLSESKGCAHGILASSSGLDWMVGTAFCCPAGLGPGSPEVADPLNTEEGSG